ncbi:flagellar protein FlgN [Cryobacterium sp. BB736]|uniref:flagellar protein FlgN n=1 Tax=Cryobacterium sp. BB736 TaxID=2746963 RepID=UPI001876F24C
MSANDVSALLWRERELLEMLLFKLEEEQLLLTAGKTRWLQHATREVEQVLDRLRAAGLTRTIEVSALAQEWGAREDATLRDLLAAAPEGTWTDIFQGHLSAMTELAAQIKEVRDGNERHLRAAVRSTQETIADLNPDAGIYTADGASSASTGSANLVDTSL